MSQTIDSVPTQFVMPRPSKGQAVLYYPNGIVGESNAQIGYVSLVGRSSIECNVHGMLRETVCHKDDPLVKENIHARKSGVWDFCHRDVEVDSKIAALEARICELENMLVGASNNKQK